MERITTPTECLPCPFCGSQPTVEPWHGGGRRKRYVGCPNEQCFVGPGVTGGTQASAFLRWNLWRGPASKKGRG